MPREHERDYSHNAILDLYRANRVNAQELSDLWNRLPSAPILKHSTQVPLNPVQGMFVVDPSIGAFCFYLGTEWICLRANPLSHAIKINGDKKANKADAADGAFKFTIDPLLDNTNLVMFGVFQGTPGAGPTTCYIKNMTRNITIATTSVTSGTTAAFNFNPDITGPANNPNNRVHLYDDIWIYCTAAATGSKGLGAYAYFDYAPELES